METETGSSSETFPGGRILAALLLLAAAVLCFMVFVAAYPLRSQAAPTVEIKDPTRTRNLTNPDGSSTDATMPVLAAETPSPAFTAAQVPSSTGFDYPVGSYWDHSGFIMYNCFGCDLDWPGFQGHTGEDFFNNRAGDPVRSVSEGVVIYKGLGPGLWGNVIIIQHKVQGVPVYSQYAHLQTMEVVYGQTVGRGERIGTVGETGTVEPHLHFEIKDTPSIGHGYTGTGFTRLTTVSAWGITYFSPSWYIETHRHIDSPFGRIDAAQFYPGGLRVSGWAIDPHTADSIDVHIYIDGHIAAAITAGDHRPDIGAAFPGWGDAHGFTSQFDVANGDHEVCAYGINVGPGRNNLIGCESIRVGGDPIGNIEAAAFDQAGQLQVSGWALDPDSVSSIDVRAYVNGELAGTATAASNRADIGAVYPDYGEQHGYAMTLPKLPGQNQVCVYGVNVASGGDALLGCKTVLAGLELFPAATPPGGRQYYWPWYDSKWGSSWLIIANPAGGSDIDFDVNLQGRQLHTGLAGNPTIASGQSHVANFSGLVGGPLVATSLSGGRAVMSQRSLWAGESLEEVTGAEATQLSDHFYWSWYDMSSPGFQNWMVVSNPGPGAVYYEITIAGQDPGAGSSGMIQPGQSAASTFPGKMGGPVEVKAWTGADKINSAMVMASQRVLSRYGKSFNEVPGIPAADLSNSYLWTWYDAIGSAGRDWVVLANPGPGAVYYEITIAGQDPGAGSSGTIQPGQSVMPTFPGQMGGPVEVRGYTDASKAQPAAILASMRVIWSGHFNEVLGMVFD